jgi:hypothetical protein
MRDPDEPKLPPRILPHDMIRDHDTRLSAARAFARYEIGDASWADEIIATYFDPAGTAIVAEEHQP